MAHMEEIGELEGKTFYILGTKTFIFIAHHLKEKAGRIVLNSTAYMEEIGELKGKKFLFEEILVFGLERPSTKDAATFVSIFIYFFHFNGMVNYIFDCGFTLQELFN